MSKIMRPTFPPIMTLLTCHSRGWSGNTDEQGTFKDEAGDRWMCCPECKSVTLGSEAVETGFVGVRDETMMKRLTAWRCKNCGREGTPDHLPEMPRGEL